MIKIENIITPSAKQWLAIINGTRNPMNSWDRTDSYCESETEFVMGENDFNLLKKLAKAGTSHSKYRRMITVCMDITAPLYWWSEYDTYKVGTVANSCSKMHKIHTRDLTLDDFSHEKLLPCLVDVLQETIDVLNESRVAFLEYKDKKYWWQMIQLLPSSYNQKRTVMLNYEVLANMYRDRKNHKLTEWVAFCKRIETLPYSELIIGDKE